jgi:outer membrane protein assembly factor BamB
MRRAQRGEGRGNSRSGRALAYDIGMSHRNSRTARIAFVFVLLVSVASLASAVDWPQWGRTPQHGGAAPVVGHPLEAILAELVYDPFAELKKADTGEALLAHYAVPLIDGTDVYMTFEAGTYTGFGNWDSQVWQVRKLRWTGTHLETVWTYDSDWKPLPIDLTVWQSVFLPALSGDGVYVPGAGGTVHEVAKATGQLVQTFNPFPNLDASRYVAGGIAVAPDGSVLYNALGLHPGDPFADPAAAWLVRISPAGAVSHVDFSTLTPGAPAADDQCKTRFPFDQRPWPPAPDAVPPTVLCGPQRPAANTVPAIASDGTIYTVSRAHRQGNYGYLVAVHSDLTPAWSATLRALVADGCGVLIPKDDVVNHCRSNAATGIDPGTNDLPAGNVSDQGTSSPVVLPDGSVLVGTQSGYNYGRGHLFRFAAAGDLLSSYDFGWDITPAVREHDGTWSVLIKDNHYNTNSGVPFYDVTSLDANLSPEWSFRATNTQSCVRDSGGTITCVDDHPDGFEWCVNQPVVDANGTVYLNSEDGNLFAFDSDGTERGRIFLDTALGAAYTPVSIGPDGVIYAQNNGKLFAVGVQRVERGTPERKPPGPRGTRAVPPR